MRTKRQRKGRQPEQKGKRVASQVAAESSDESEASSPDESLVLLDCIEVE